MVATTAAEIQTVFNGILFAPL